MSDAAHWGVFGGSFDPPHLGHQRAAFEALETLDLAGVLWVPTPQNPLKHAPEAAADERLALVRAATADVDGFAVGEAEIHRDGAAYTADTLAQLAAAHPGRRWTLILGADAWDGLAQWERPLAVLEAAEIAVLVRPEVTRRDPRSVLESLDANGAFCYDQDQQDAWTIRFAGDQPTPRITRVRFLSTTALDISSTAIRALIGAGRDPKFLLSESVYQQIEDRGLYGIRRR